MHWSVEHQQACLTRPIVPSLVAGGLFTGLNVVLQGIPFHPRLFGVNFGGIYLYNALQCPMEAIEGRQSALHNVISGGLIGFMGIRAGILGVPFVDYYFFARYPQISPPIAGAAIYGAITGVLATIGGKPF